MTGVWISAVAAEIILAAGFLFGMDAFAHLKLTVPGFWGLLCGWTVSRLGADMLSRKSGAGEWGRISVELAGPALWILAANPWLKQPWSGAQSVYAALGVGLIWRAWRWSLGRSGGHPTGEILRRLFVVTVGSGVVAAYFTDLQIGGTDARWYTGVHLDFLQQLRSGSFPVFVGQGEYAFNGSMNLFRTAPLCLWISGLCDWLTAQSLSMVAVRNLGIVVVAQLAGFGMYSVLNRLSDVGAGGAGEAVRWTAALMTALYLLCPGLLMTLYFYELQMTFTALVALPWIFYGIVLLLEEESGRGFVPLAAGLALCWYAHVPLAIISTLSGVVVLIGRLIFEPDVIRRWKQAVAGAGLFGLLICYYFAGMSELPSRLGSAPRKEAVLLVSVGLGVFGTVRFFCHGQWTGVLAVLVGAVAAGWLQPAWTAWIVAWFAVFGAVVLVLRWRRVRTTAARLVLVATGCMLVAAVLADIWATSHGLVRDFYLIQNLGQNGDARLDLLRPIGGSVRPYGTCQPGYALWLLLAATVIAAWVRRNLTLALLAVPQLLLAVLILALPRASDFIVGFAPTEIGALVSLPLLYRLVPVLAALVVVAGFRLLGPAGLRSKVRAWLIVAGLVFAVGWTGWQVRPVIQLGFNYTNPRLATAQRLSPDNYTLGRFSYLMLPIPPDFIDGKQFHWLETRLLDLEGNVRVGPDQLAREAENYQVDTLELTSSAAEGSADWLFIKPGWEIQPGETLILRFEFFPDMNAAGWLIFQSENGYMEQYLEPTSIGTGFGLGGKASRVTAVSNSGRKTENYRLQMKLGPGNNLPRDGRPWAKLHVSRYDPAVAPIQVHSLIPYRASIKAEVAGFLETPRQWVAGYQAWVDGQRVEPVSSGSTQAAIPVPAGTHEVELKFVGTVRLWVSLLISAATGIVVLAWAGSGGWAGLRSVRGRSVEAFIQWKNQNQA